MDFKERYYNVKWQDILRRIKILKEEVGDTENVAYIDIEGNPCSISDLLDSLCTEFSLMTAEN